MKSFIIPTLIMALWAAMPACADSPTPAQVIARHVKAVVAGDVDGVLADYADNAVLVSPQGMVTASGIFAGKAKVREFFKWLAGPDNMPGVKSMVTQDELVGAEVVRMHWFQFKGTPKEASGWDVFVIHDGKIVFQVVKAS